MNTKSQIIGNELQYESEGDTMQSRDLGDSHNTKILGGMMGGMMGGGGDDGGEGEDDGKGGGGFIGDQTVSGAGNISTSMDPGFGNADAFFASVFGAQQQAQTTNWPLIALGAGLVGLLFFAVWKSGDKNNAKANKNIANVR